MSIRFLRVSGLCFPLRAGLPNVLHLPCVLLRIITPDVLLIKPGHTAALPRSAVFRHVQIPYLRSHLIVDQILAGAIIHGLQSASHAPRLLHRRKIFLCQREIRFGKTVRHSPGQSLAAQCCRKSLHVQIIRIALDILARTHQLCLDLVYDGHCFLRIHPGKVEALLLHFGIVFLRHGM